MFWEIVWFLLKAIVTSMLFLITVELIRSVIKVFKEGL